MIKIGIIAGGGSLPLLIANNLAKRGYTVFIMCIKNYAKIDNFKDFNSIEINTTDFPNGIYMYSINNGEEFLTKRMIVAN